MKTYRRLPQYASNGLLALIGAVALCPLFAKAQVVRPDPAGVAAIERAKETVLPEEAFENLETKTGDWAVGEPTAYSPGSTS